jgi:hypothetical protein
MRTKAVKEGSIMNELKRKIMELLNEQYEKDFSILTQSRIRFNQSRREYGQK